MKIIAFVILFAIFCSKTAISQNKIESPIDPIDQSKQYWGFFLGLGQNNNSGKFHVECQACEFEQGTGFGWTIGALYEFQLKELNSYWGASLFYSDFSFSNEYIIRDTRFYTNQATNTQEPISLDFTQQADLAIGAVGFNAHYKQYLGRFFYVRLSAGPLFFINTQLTHTEKLNTRTAQLSDGTIVEPKLENNGVLQEGDLPAANSIGLIVIPAIGTEFGIGQNNTMGFNFSYNLLPGNLLGDTPRNSEINLSGWRLMVEFRFDNSPKGL